jgi:hypothetical protein
MRDLARGVAALLLGGCGELHPFADGSASASGGASASGDTSASSGAAVDTDGVDGPRGLLYVRCPRTRAPLEVTADVTKNGEVVSVTKTFRHTDVYDVLPSALRVAEMLAPCDLVLRADDGAESVVFDCSAGSTEAETCVAIDPAVSHDGTKVAFAVVHGSIGHYSENVSAQALDPDADAGNASEYATVPNPALAPVRGDIHIVDLVTGEAVIAAGAEGEIRRAPSFLHDGRVMFTSNVVGELATVVRAGGGQSSGDLEVTDVWAMSVDGHDVVRLGAHTTTSSQAPLQLKDGRVVVVATQRVGMLPYRYTNGSPGWAGALTNIHHLYAQDPDGARLTALFGQHTHLVVGAFEHSAAVGMAQLGDGRLVFVEGGGVAGAGALRTFVPDPEGREGPAPHTVDPADVFRPSDMLDLAPWAGQGFGFSASMPAPEMRVPGYADPLAHAGFLRDPVGEPDDAMLVTWVKGACSASASNGDVALYGDPPPPATSGAYGLVPLNALEWLGRDNPGCDAGIYRGPTSGIEHPSVLDVVVDTPEFHEFMATPVRPFAVLHGQATPDPIAPSHRRAVPSDALPFATPFALLGGSSLLQQETRSFEGNLFGSEVHWALQGAQTSDWVDDEVCGVRITALMANRTDEGTGDAQALFNALGHRAVVLAELPVRKFDAGVPVLDPLGDPDTSFRLRVPADTPLLVGGLDCEGRSLSSSQVPFSLRPGEDRTCGGCHVRSGLPLRFDETAAAGQPPLLAGEGTVQLLAGGGGDAVETEVVAGFGATWEFERDVWPILQSRCVECHGGDAPAAGLPLDLPGREPGSTWWRLAADYPQEYVPVEQQTVPGVLRKPQLSRYVRFLAARGSLLYWKAANARLDGRTDADFADGEDVDFGADHPSAITPSELRTLARWIDLGASFGAEARGDTAKPIVVARIDAAAPGTLVVGTTDVGAGIDADSLVVRWSQDGGAWMDLTVPSATVGTVEVGLAGVPQDATLRITVRDAAGNVTAIERTRAGLVED